jgi:hypothetical protein
MVRQIKNIKGGQDKYILSSLIGNPLALMIMPHIINRSFLDFSVR